MIATAVASTLPAASGAVEIATVGVLVYPLPSSLSVISRIYPLLITFSCAFAVAVVPAPINCNFLINPISSICSSTSSIPVSIISSSSAPL